MIESKLKSINVFNSLEQYNENKGSIGADELCLVPTTSDIVPTGFVIHSATNEIPEGYLLCNGGAVSRSTYANLFAKIGTAFGVGDGSTTFNLPNVTDRFIQGSATVGTVKSASASLPDHYHAFGYNTANNGGRFIATSATATYALASGVAYRGWNGSGGGGGFTNDATTASSANMVTSLQTATSTTTIQPPALTMRFYIKY